MKSTVYLLQLLSILLLALSACKEKDPPNPFDQVDKPTGPDTSSITLEATNIEGLHANIFGKTCANSGCHDGTFEPDYRTIESTYNTLVFQPIIKNDLQGTYTYRVLPGNPNSSQLIARLTFDIDGNSGIMPLALEPNSDWNEKKADYIQNVKDWIQKGAPDILGNPAVLNNNGRPGMLGVDGRAGDWLGREDGGLGALRVPRSQPTLDIYLALSDDKTAPNQLGNNKIRFSKIVDGFETEMETSVQILSTPVERPGYEGNLVKYYHKISIDPMAYAANPGDIVYFRVYVKDDANPVTEIPSDGGAYYIKNYFSFILIE